MATSEEKRDSPSPLIKDAPPSPVAAAETNQKDSGLVDSTDMEVEFKVPPVSPAPPHAARAAASAASRRSMLSITRRQSQSMAGGGIAFEDQVGNEKKYVEN